MNDETNTIERSDGIAIGGERTPSPQTTAEPTQAAGDDVESKARSQGWVPQDEWRGDPEKWRPADEFVKRGEELLPVALERSRAAERKAQELEARLAARERESEEKLARLERMSTAALQRQREQLENAYRNAMRDAVTSGDTQRFDQLERDRTTAVADFDKQLSEQAQPQRQPGQPAPLPPDIERQVATWVQQNEWFNRDPEMNSVAQLHHQRLLREKPGLSIADNLAETAKYVRQRYPDKFGTSERQIIAPMVEGGGGRMAATGNNRRKGVADLSPEERKIGEKFVKVDKLYPNLDAYAQDLFYGDN